jgi:RNA polymerase sigma-70 factor (ECF subfamily)
MDARAGLFTVDRYEFAGNTDWLMADTDPRPEESELRVFLSRIREGDEDAARELLRRYEPHVRLVVRRHLPRLLRSRFDSLDFVQSIWKSFFRRVRTSPTALEGTENLVGFLARAARYKVIDEYRKASSDKQDMRREESMWEGTELRELADRCETPLEIAEAAEAFGRLREMVPENRRAILDLKAAGLSAAEIAERLGVSERSVRRVIENLRHRAGIDGQGEA